MGLNKDSLSETKVRTALITLINEAYFDLGKDPLREERERDLNFLHGLNKKESKSIEDIIAVTQQLVRQFPDTDSIRNRLRTRWGSLVKDVEQSRKAKRGGRKSKIEIETDKQKELAEKRKQHWEKLKPKQRKTYLEAARESMRESNPQAFQFLDKNGIDDSIMVLPHAQARAYQELG